MAIRFWKYHGTGNDFILIDDRRKLPDANSHIQQSQLAAWCDRHTGIGADGVILIRESVQADFEMVFFNSDGRPGSMCGNGGRCAAAFANRLGIFRRETVFMAPDGLHQALITGKHGRRTEVSLGLKNVSMPGSGQAHYFVDTGSPHLVYFSQGVSDLDVAVKGRQIRNSPDHMQEGVNVNFAERLRNGTLFVRTYERGVEDETLSCGTGVTAVAIAAWKHFPEHRAGSWQITTRGGSLKVTFSPPESAQREFRDVFLHGPAELVFSGSIPSAVTPRAEKK